MKQLIVNLDQVDDFIEPKNKGILYLTWMEL